MMNTNIAEWAALALTILFYGILFYLGNKKKVHFGILTILASGMGIIVGLVFKENYTYVAAFGTIYTHVIKALVVPLLLFSIISSITNLGEQVKLQKLGLKTVFYLLLNTFTASVITLLVAVGLHVGEGFVYQTATDYTPAEVPTFLDTIVSLFPQNLINEWSEGQVVPIVVFALIIAVAYNQIHKEKSEVNAFKSFIDAGNQVIGQAVGIVIDFTPFAVLSLIARAVGRAEVKDLFPLLGILVVAYVLCAIQLFVVESLFIKFIAKLSPVKFLKKIAPAGIVAFTSQSSVGTIPVTVKQLEHELGVQGNVASFTASLGANLGMPGCAGMWPVLLAVFSINVLGIEYSISQYILLIILALVVSIGTVGVPGTATITATALFSAAGLPIELIVLLAPISSIVDMARTATNVVGAATAAVIVAESEGFLDHEQYNKEIESKRFDFT